MNIERKSYKITNLKTDDLGTLEAIVSVFGNVDSGNEIVRPGFFQKSIERKLPKGVWSHDWKQPIAKTLEARELEPGDPLLPADLKTRGGAYIKGQFNLETQRGREAYSDIKFGIIDEFSIGYSVLKDSKDKETGARELIEGDWKEWSPVLVGMNDQTRLISIKAEGDEPEAKSEDLSLKESTVSDSFESFESAVSAIEKHTANMQRNHENRVKEGRILSSSNRAKVVAARDALDGLLAASEPPAKEKQIDVVALRAQSDRIRNSLMNLMQ